MSSAAAANPKAFLCSLDGTYNFPVLPKLTTIGREGCDIVINSSTIDNQHALVEYLEEDNCFILQDLNSSTGTFVNECRIQNSAVRLVEQDTIRFGFNGQPFQFIVQSQFNIIPPINLGQTTQQQSNKTLQIINQTVPIRSRLNTPPLVQQQQLYQQVNTKPPSSLRTRPISAGSGSRFSKDFSQNVASRPQWTMKIYNTESDQYLSSNSNNTVGGAAGARFNTMNQTSFTVNLEEGGQKQDCVNSETYRQDNDFGIRIANLEREIRSKSYEIKDLKDKLSFYQGSGNCGQQQQQQHQQSFSINTGLNPTVEMEQMRRDKSIAVGLVNTMQKDLNNKDVTINKLGRDIEVYKRQVAEREKQIGELEEKLKQATDSHSKVKDEEASNREKELTVLNARLLEAKDKTIDLTNQVLQIRNELEESQKQTHKFVENEKKLKLEIEHWKTQYADMQRTERTVRKDLDEIKRGHDKFRNTIIQAIYTTPGVTNPTLDTTDEDILAQWKKMFDERSKLVLKIEQLNHSLNTSVETVNSVSSLEIKLRNQEDNLEASGRRPNTLESIVTELEDLKLNEETEKLKEVVIKSYSNQLKWQSELETVLTDLFDVDMKKTESLVVVLGQVKARLVADHEERVKIEQELKAVEETHKQKLQDEIDLFNAKLFEAEDRLKAEHQAKIDSLKKENDEFVAVIKLDFESQLKKLRDEKEKLSERIELILVEEETIITERNDLRAKLETMDTENLEKLMALSKSVDELNEQIRIKEEEYTKSIEEARLNVVKEQENYNNSLESYREQIKQHSLTIINFEKEMAVFHEKEIEYKNKIIQLEKQLREKMPTPPPPPPPQPKAIVIQANEQEVLQLNKTIDLLRSECQTYKSKLMEQDELIRTLRRDLSGASAKLSDVHGELTEKQKRELERNKQLVIEQQRELSDNRAQLAKLSEIVDKQTKQLETLKTELSKAKSVSEKFKVTAEENGVLCVQLREKLAEVESQLSKFGTIKKEESKIANELTAIGAQCKGERHEQVIARQREALNELRQRVKALETGQPATPLQQVQMQQQIILLKKQLAEMRASQAMTDDIKQQANMIHGNDQSMLMIEEKTAHHETQFALEASEETYLTLLRTLATILGVGELDGLRSMANLPPDERHGLVRERSRGVEALCFKIKNLLEKIDRQEALLKDYELDLGRLRQMEFLLNKKSEQLDSIEIQTVSKEDEINYLRESLKNTRSDLEKEKYLNSAIKQKKPIHTIQSQSERVRRGSTERLHHHCTPTTDPTAVKVKKELSETIKRKDYELKTLKGDLKSKSNELAALSSRLSIVENSQFNN